MFFSKILSLYLVGCAKRLTTTSIRPTHIPVLLTACTTDVKHLISIIRTALPAALKFEVRVRICPLKSSHWNSYRVIREAEYLRWFFHCFRTRPSCREVRQPSFPAVVEPTTIVPELRCSHWVKDLQKTKVSATLNSRTHYLPPELQKPP
jgi:hypothetical protein